MSSDEMTAQVRAEQELALVLCAPCGSCGHEVEDHAPEGCLIGGCRCEADMTGVEVTSVLASSWLAQRDARIRAEAAAEALRSVAVDGAAFLGAEGGDYGLAWGYLGIKAEWYERRAARLAGGAE
jgi:hypothetical protein